jgi:hypothetical protein
MDTCAVCHENLHEHTVIDCGHAFHYECIIEWLKHQQNCPLCRRNTAIPIDKRMIMYDPAIEKAIVPYVPEIRDLPPDAIQGFADDYYDRFIDGTFSSTLTVYATSFNVLRIMSGMGSLIYSN